MKNNFGFLIFLLTGICACMVIYLVTCYEFSFNRFHADKDRIYRIVGEMQRSSGEKEFVNSPFPDVAGFQNQIPRFETAAGVSNIKILYNSEVKELEGDENIKAY